MSSEGRSRKGLASELLVVEGGRTGLGSGIISFRTIEYEVSQANHAGRDVIMVHGLRGAGSRNSRTSVSWGCTTSLCREFLVIGAEQFAAVRSITSQVVIGNRLDSVYILFNFRIKSSVTDGGIVDVYGDPWLRFRLRSRTRS